MNFSIIIPTFENYNYLSLCLESIQKNSYYDHEIIIHINGLDTQTKNLILEKKLAYTESEKNIGLCSGVNLAAKKSSTKYIVYAHDDMYFLPKWDYYLAEEISDLNSNLFYFSSTQISHISYKKGKGIPNHIYFDAGKDIESFDEKKILQNFEKLDFYDLQGSHWAPHVIHKDIWDKIGGFSEEFDPGFGSDPDLNMKLWQIGVRIFKGVNKSRIYHFGSLTTRKNKDVVQNKGRKTFLMKWKISTDFFTKFYLLRGNKYYGPLKVPGFTLLYIFSLLANKIVYFFYKWIKN